MLRLPVSPFSFPDSAAPTLISTKRAAFHSLLQKLR